MAYEENNHTAPLSALEKQDRKVDDTNPKDRIGDTKPQLHLVPAALEIHVSQAMADGAKKYGAYNWRTRKVKLSVYVSAALRHLRSYFDGEDVARDSKRLHLAHAGACIAILLDALETGNLIDDRPAKGCAGDLIERLSVLSAVVALAPPSAKDVEEPKRLLPANPPYIECDCDVCDQLRKSEEADQGQAMRSIP